MQVKYLMKYLTCKIHKHKFLADHLTVVKCEKSLVFSKISNDRASSISTFNHLSQYSFLNIDL